jgi:1,6-anhydro-N-acetylmuramate kinase
LKITVFNGKSFTLRGDIEVGNNEDVSQIANLADAFSEKIFNSYNAMIEECPDVVYLSGGGSLNTTLVDRIKKRIEKIQDYDGKFTRLATAHGGCSIIADESM